MAWRGQRGSQRVVLRADESVSMSRCRLHVCRRVHDCRAPDSRLGAAGRSKPVASRAAREGSRPQSPHRGVRPVFRSERLVLRVGGGRRSGPRRPRELIEQYFGRSLTVGVEEELWILDAETLELTPKVEADRKSTRLNSSHTVISYA